MPVPAAGSDILLYLFLQIGIFQFYHLFPRKYDQLSRYWETPCALVRFVLKKWIFGRKCRYVPGSPHQTLSMISGNGVTVMTSRNEAAGALPIIIHHSDEQSFVLCCRGRRLASKHSLPPLVELVAAL